MQEPDSQRGEEAYFGGDTVYIYHIACTSHIVDIIKSV